MNERLTPKSKVSPSDLKPHDKRLYDLGSQLNMFIETGYYKKRPMFIFSFLQGIARGVGAAIGATLVIAILIWILSLFNEVPFVGHFTNKIQHTIQQSTPE